VRDDDPLRNICRAAERRGLLVRSWTNNTHSTALASANPGCAIQNVFGDTYINSLCPANPDVRAYVTTLNSDLARYPLDTLLVESVCYMPFDHGYHHERCLVPISALAKFFLGLCFCDHCVSKVAAEGVDADALRKHVVEQLDLHLAGDPSELDGIAFTKDAVEQFAGGDMTAMLAARQSIVTSLIHEVKDAVGAVSSAPVMVMEWSGGLRGAGMGMPVGDTSTAAPDRAWQDGVDLQSVRTASDGVGVLGYVRLVDELRRDLDAYRSLLGPDTPLSVALRPMPPDCNSPAELAEKVAFLRDFGADWAEFYHYGFMRLRNLQWIGEVLSDRASNQPKTL
jgi:hypothetical protein